MRGARRLALSGWALVLLAAASAPAAGQQTRSPAMGGADLLTALRAGGFILYFRHADTDFKQTDVRPVNLADCTQQRNLTDKGREHARNIGAAIRELTIPIGPVLASPMCRTVETAELAFGPAERSMAVREGGPTPPGSPDRYAALRAMLSTPPPAGGNMVIVGHAYPIYTLIGGQYLEEGEAAVVRPQGSAFEVVARVGLKEWRELAQLPLKRE
ncbi:MAG TPA: histidine phosphatase family protein [Methylomirabilota bacterium]|nr:histidine phosphatase family protein [Methylomirabilota bacterium]